MRSHSFSVLLVTSVCAAVPFSVISADAVRARQSAPVDQTLRVAGEYVRQYERAIQGLVVQEDYQQTVLTNSRGLTGPGSRKLRSDLLVFNGGRSGWIAFRDVFEVDGHPVRDREERLSRLFSQVTPDALQQARRLAAESSRYNLNAPGVVLDRTINTPMTALLFLRMAEQERSTFKPGRTDQIDGRPFVRLTFIERAKPTLIGSNGEATTQGTFWIEAKTGRVVQSDLRVESVVGTKGFVRARVFVKYAQVPKLALWLPRTMDEQYELEPGRQTITGHASYSDFRQFAVTTSEGGTS